MNNHCVWGFDDLAASKPAATIRGFEYPWFLAADEGELFVAETSGARISVYDEATGDYRREWKMNWSPTPTDVLEDGWTQGIAVAGGELYAARPGDLHLHQAQAQGRRLQRITVHDTRTGAVVREWPVHFGGGHSFGASLALIDGRVFVTRPGCTSGGSVVVYDTHGTKLDADFGNGRVRGAVGVAALGKRFVCVTVEDRPSRQRGTRVSAVILTRDGGCVVRRLVLAELGVRHCTTALIAADEEHLYVSTEDNVAILAHGLAVS